MQTDFLLNQQIVREVALTPLRDRAWSREAPTGARRPSFDSLTIGFHWATVFLVLAMFASAWLHALAEARQSDFTPVLLQIHRSIGVTIWVVTALRLAWRLTKVSLPPFPPHMSRLHRATVKLSEYGLYALLLAQPATGLLTTVFSGRPFALFWWEVSPLLPRDEMLRAAFHLSHEIGAWAFAALIVGHAAAALFHHFVLRDDVLEWMAPAIRRPDPSGRLVTAISFQPETQSGIKATRRRSCQRDAATPLSS
jgi:cytochrome b561